MMIIFYKKDILKLLFTLLLIFQTFSSANASQRKLSNITQPTLSSKEDSTFYNKSEYEIINAFMGPEFIGILERNNAVNTDMAQVNAYYFNSDLIKVSNTLCKDISEKIWGLSQSKIYRLKSMKTIPSAKGNICVAVLTDSEASYKYKKNHSMPYYFSLAIIGFLNAKATAIVFTPTDITAEKTQEALQVWNNLR